jgi:parallel beta-helix repeat protein
MKIIKYGRLAVKWTLLIPVVLIIAFGGVLLGPRLHAANPSAPTSPTPICGQSILNSPYTYNGAAGPYTSGTAGLPTFGTAGSDFPSATAGLVVAAGDNTAAGNSGTYQVTNTVVYFEPGTHQLKGGMFSGHDSVYIGGYSTTVGKAIIDGVDGATNGTGVGGSAFAASQPQSPGSNNVYNTWEYLTVQNFTSSENGAVMGIVNGGSFDVGDTYKYDTIGPNTYGYDGNNVAPLNGQNSGGGYAIGLGSNTTIEYNCINQNAQGGFNGWGVNINISNNEIGHNALGVYPDDGNNPKSCGCSGGGKLFNTVNATVDNNYVHDNYSAGIWLDFDNTGADISGNYISSNWGNGIAYESSYNANITNNTLLGNGWASDGTWPSGGSYQCDGGMSCTNGAGPLTGATGGFPYAAIYLANTGGNSNLTSINIPSNVTVNGCSSNCSVLSRYSGQVLVEGNVLNNNFGGVMIYTDTNRFPNNIDNDSACSVPLGSGADGQQANSTTYYRQTKVLQVNGDAVVSGSTVTTASGTQTICDNYGVTAANETDAGQAFNLQAPEIGMGVFDENSNKFLGNIASVTDAHSFTLNSSVAGATSETTSNASLLMSAYGGCGPADYWNSGPNIASGVPSANYWDNCLWGSHDVTVSGNTLSLQANTVTGCTIANMCGFEGNVAFVAGVPDLMHYWGNYPTLIANASGGLNNVFSSNTYYWQAGTGTPSGWQFWAGNQGTQVSQAQWVAAPYTQDAGSSFNNGSPPSGKIGDFNNDGSVNITDLSILLSAWGTSNSTVLTNLNQTGIVNITCLSIFLSHWGT